MSQYAKVDEMENMRLQGPLGPIFAFRSAESATLLEATLELCRKIRVYNEIFLQINEECKQSTQPVKQMNSPEPVSAPDQVQLTTFAQCHTLIARVTSSTRNDHIGS